MTWETAASGSAIIRALLAEIEIQSGSICVHDGVGVLSWDSKTWQGVGSLGQVSGIAGSVDLDATSLNVGLTGVPTEYREEILSELARGRGFHLYLGLIDPAAGTWSAEPVEVWSGFQDAPQITESAEDNLGAFLTITIPILSATAYARRLKIWRRTDADQQRLFAGDLFFQFKTDMRIPVAGSGGFQPGGDHNSSQGRANPRIWMSKLASVLRAYEREPFEWGKRDCLRFGLEASAAAGNRDLTALLPSYSTKLGALRALRDSGFASLIDALDAHAKPVPPLTARTGDIAHAYQRPMGIVGVVVGGEALFLSADGYLKMSLRECFIWRP